MPLSIMSEPRSPLLSHRRPFADKFSTSLRKRWYGAKRQPGRGKTVRCRYFGTNFIVSLEDEVGYEIALNRFEWRELKLMLDACERLKPEVFVDVGANLGLYSCVLGRHKAVPRIVAFEPDHANFARLTANLKLNNLTDLVEAREVGAGSKAGTETLLPAGEDNRGVSRIVPGTGEAAGQDAYSIPIVALDDVVRVDGSRIVVKIDVEGFELEVLMGAAQLFTRNGGFAQIEAHGNQVSGVVTELMATFGWRFIERYGLDLRFEKA
jgi:FkbM family methyltransferase